MISVINIDKFAIEALKKLVFRPKKHLMHTFINLNSIELLLLDVVGSYINKYWLSVIVVFSSSFLLVLFDLSRTKKHRWNIKWKQV